MAKWAIKRTATFAKHLKKHKGHHQLFVELGKVIKRLQKDPSVIGGELSGKLHGKKSTRLTKKYRLIFEISEKKKTVYLVAIDHRGKVYD